MHLGFITSRQETTYKVFDTLRKQNHIWTLHQEIMCNLHVYSFLSNKASAPLPFRAV